MKCLKMQKQCLLGLLNASESDCIMCIMRCILVVTQK